MREFMLKFIIVLLMVFVVSQTYSQDNLPPALEGGRGFINTQTAYNFGKGYLGVKFSSIYNTTKLAGQSDREQLFIGASSFTYDLSDDVEFSAMLYAIGQSVTVGSSTGKDVLQSGFGKSVLAFKYKTPIEPADFDLGFRTALHIPMGANFMIFPSYPYDSNIYSLELIGLQSFHLNSKLRIHVNEGYRWQGLRAAYVGKEDLWLTSTALDYDLKKGWSGYSEIASALEMDDNIEPLRDRLIFTQGFHYNTPWNFGVNLSGNFRLNQKRKDNTPTRAENWRLMLGLSFSTRTIQLDDDHDGIANDKDVEPNTPKGWPVDSRGRAFDSDADGIADGIDQEAQTPKGAIVDKFGRAIDSDNDGVPDGIDQEPNTPTGAVVNVKGVAIDSDGDGVPDGLDQEPNTPVGAKVDREGREIKSDLELTLLTKGFLRVQKIYFDIGKSTIRPESFEILNQLGRIFTKYEELKIEIAGHTDATGTDEFNMQLSIDRANAVKTFLVQRFDDINPDNLTTLGFGRTKPVSDDKTETGRTLNRRVEFRVLNIEAIKK